MKSKVLIASAIAIACCGMYNQASAQRFNNTTPGILLSGSCDTSALPKTATDFLDKHFRGVKVKKCTHDYADATYKVKLSNGVEVEFGNDGKVVEIEAADKGRLSEAVIKEVVPSKTYKYIKSNKMIANVEGIEYSRGRVVEIDLAVKGPDTVVFDLDGNFLVIED